MTTTTLSLGEALPQEIKRNQELVRIYQELGAVGNFARIMVQADIDAAVKALAEGDTVAMIRAYKALEGNQA